MLSINATTRHMATPPLITIAHLPTSLTQDSARKPEHTRPEFQESKPPKQQKDEEDDKRSIKVAVALGLAIGFLMPLPEFLTPKKKENIEQSGGENTGAASPEELERAQQ
ncbi:hypothetical protein G7Y89_g10117 [Cudoniella acicularis]|uniref:Uncharacterized protein n=1 Tax=Cudoniella acicularis TaxID=354080 RepID=A0A8H4RDD5_9HELO|nr:hypothetical protein G7Y89_g10117 [Cudoniella acicularis]